MTLEPTDQFDVIVAEGLRGRAAHATVHGRGMGDVRRRIRRRRQRQMAVGLVPAVAGLGWAVTRPVADAPLTPSGEAGPCGDTSTTRLDGTTWMGGEMMTTTVPPTTWMEINTTWEPDVTVTTITFDPDGNVVVPYTGPTVPPFTGGVTTTYPFESSVSDGSLSTTTSAPVAWTGPTTSLPMLDGDGNPILVATTWVDETSTTWAGDATTTTICEPGTVPNTSVVPVTTGFGDSTTTTILFGDFTSTKVQVANCSATNGVAGMMSSVLAEVGFTTVEATNGTCDPKLDSSYVVYDEGVPGADDVAHALADMLGGLMAEPGILPIKVESAAWAEGSGVVLYLGNDLAGKTLGQIQGQTVVATTE